MFVQLLLADFIVLPSTVLLQILVLVKSSGLTTKGTEGLFFH